MCFGIDSRKFSRASYAFWVLRQQWQTMPWLSLMDPRPWCAIVSEMLNGKQNKTSEHLNWWNTLGCLFSPRLPRSVLHRLHTRCSFSHRCNKSYMLQASMVWENTIHKWQRQDLRSLNSKTSMMVSWKGIQLILHENPPTICWVGPTGPDSPCWLCWLTLPRCQLWSPPCKAVTSVPREAVF